MRKKTMTWFNSYIKALANHHHHPPQLRSLRDDLAPQATSFYKNNLIYKTPCEQKIPGTREFQSQLRQGEAEDIDDPYRFIGNFLCEQDVYIPALFFPEARAGQRVTLKVQGHVPSSLKPITFERSDFERLDYVASN